MTFEGWKDMDLYKASAKEPQIIDVPAMNFLMIDGEGTPDSQEFQDAVQALYGVAYTIKFTLKKPDRGLSIRFRHLKDSGGQRAANAGSIPMIRPTGDGRL
jgi:hypothetical protein